MSEDAKDSIASRKRSMSKRRRFDVFKRDGFTCQYCGRKPPNVTLEVDHIVAVVAGGSDDEHNLITACFDCNRGKGKNKLKAKKSNIKKQLNALEDRLAQAEAYELMLLAQREAEDFAVDQVHSVFRYHHPGYSLNERATTSIRNFLRRLPKLEIMEAMEIACARMDQYNSFRYFCGICWNKINNPETM